MLAKIINAANIAEERKLYNSAEKIALYDGDAKFNLQNESVKSRGQQIVTAGDSQWYGTKKYIELWDEIGHLAHEVQNAAQNPAQATIDALLGALIIDMTRASQVAQDYTPLFATEINDPNAPATITMSYIYEYVGEWMTMAGTGDSTPLIEQKLGGTDTFALAIGGAGWKESLANLLYNRLRDMQKVIRAAVAARTDARNAKTIGAIVGATFVATQKVAADTTGTSYDVKMYNTFRKAYKKMFTLKDPKTGLPIRMPAISILCNSTNSWDIQRCIRGQLQNTGDKGNGGMTSQNLQALPIQNIIEYDGGLTNGATYGKKTLSFAGVTAGKCYMFVPREYLHVVNKRGMTPATSDGSALQLSVKEYSWYDVNGIYDVDFLGSSKAATALGASYGAILEITLPTDS